MKKNKRDILITGSSSGLGFEIAKYFYKKKDYRVGINGRNLSKLRSIQKRFSKFLISPGDVSKNNIAKKVIKNFVKFNGKIDTLVCNVGNGSISKIKDKGHINLLKEMFDMNFWSSINMIENALPYLKKTRGNIICISSICGIEKIEGAPLSYSVAKSALNTFVKNYSFELGRFNIRINAILPGNLIFKGSVWEKKMKHEKNKTLNYVKRNVPLNNFGNPLDIVSMIEFLESEKSSFITGSLIRIDGGQTKSI